MNVNDFSDDSDSSDEDYIPGAKPEEVVSEVDSDGDIEEPLSDTEGSPKKRRSRPKKSCRTKKLKTESQNSNSDDTTVTSPKITEEEKKKQADDLWADFLQDTGFKSKTATSKTSQTNISQKETIAKFEMPTKSKINEKKQPEKVKITEIFEYAGEEIKVEKEVPKDSAEARLLGTSSKTNTNKIDRKGSNLNGIGSILNQLGKKKKISTLEKTMLDWNRFKKDEKLEEELAAHNKGKDGYLERQEFLQRADLRRFEIEKEIRAVERNKRMNLGEPF